MDGDDVKHVWAWRVVIAAAAAGAGLVGCTGIPTERPSPEPSRAVTVEPAPASSSAVFVSVVDGDTVRTSVGVVRLIGIDTPERGECGHQETSATIGRLVSAGDPITLELPAGQHDQDRHGRLLRYVTTDAGIDLGLTQLVEGHAVARYDSTDGYPAHPREAAYHDAQIAALSADGVVLPTSCEGPASGSAAPPDVDRWWERYSSCGRLKKNDVGDPTGPFRRDDPAEAEIYAWFTAGTGNNGDGDGDGLACE